MAEQQTIVISQSVLRAALPFASKEKTRESVCGIYLHKGLAIATDGQALAVLKPHLWWTDGDEGHILSAETVKSVLKVTPSVKTRHVFIIARIAKERSSVEVRESVTSTAIRYAACIDRAVGEGSDYIEAVQSTSELLATLPLLLLNGRFPEWQRVFPKIEKFTNSESTHCFTSELLARFSCLGDRGKLITGNTNIPAVFLADHLGKDFHAAGIVMTLPSQVEKQYPDWLDAAIGANNKQPFEKGDLK